MPRAQLSFKRERNKEIRRNRLEEKLRNYEHYAEIEELVDPLTKMLNAYGEKKLSIGNQTLDVLKGNDGEAQAKSQSTLISKSFEFPQSIFSTPLTMP